MPSDEVEVHDITYEVFLAKMLNLNIFKSPNLTHSLQEIQGRGEQVEQHWKKETNSGNGSTLY